MQGYVRGIVEQKLDVLVPISHQPRDLVTDIIADASGKFPDFASCVRKRIRTFLKSYRRSRKLKEGYIPTSNGIGRVRRVRCRSYYSSGVVVCNLWECGLNCSF